MITLKKILPWGFFNSCSCMCRALELLWQHPGPAAVPEPSGSNREDCEGTNLLAALGSSEWIWVLKTVKMTVVFRVSIRPTWFFCLGFFWRRLLWTEFRREIFLECRLDYSAKKACEDLLYGREEMLFHMCMCLILGFQFCPFHFFSGLLS